MPLSDAQRQAYEQALLELRTLQRVADELSRSLDLDVVLGRCLDLAIEVAHAMGGVIYLHDSARHHFRRVVTRVVSDEIAPPMMPEEGMRNALTGNSLQLECVADSEVAMVRAAHAAGIRLVLLLSLRNEGVLVGLLAVHLRESELLPGSLLQTLEAIARQETVAISNARAHQSLALRSRMADGVREFAERALVCSDHHELYERILESALKLTGNDRGLISRVDGDKVRVVAAAGADQDMLGFEMPADAPYMAEALANHDMLVREDTADIDPQTMVGREVHRKGTRAFVLTTVRMGGRPVGVLYAGSGTPRHYEPEEREALKILATVAGEALERVRALEQLAEEKRRLDAVLEHLPIVVTVVRADGERINVNAAGRAFTDSFGGANNWHETVRLLQTLDSEGRPIARENMMVMRAFRGERPPPTEVTLVSSDGRHRRHVLGVAAPLFGPDGKVEAVVTGFQDVTALRHAVEAKDHFLRIASHELRSPLTALRATTSLLEMDPSAITDDARRGLMLERVQRQVGRLTRLVEQLIDSVRFSGTEPPLERTETDLVAMCKDAIAALPESARVTLQAPPSLVGSWDVFRLEQVMNNLLSNAVRYSPAGSPIEVNLSLGAGSAIVEVTDRGIGIPEDQQERLCSPFFRASNAAAQSKGGLGLGLHITREIVTRHGGNLRVRSKVGEGSTFTVELPLKQERA